MTGASDFTKMVPGFDFLQNLMKGAGAGMPQISQWVAPTLDPAELEKRIQDLKTVQFWLEQNTRLLSTTIQALEVQRMTLNTLKTMNLPLADLGAALFAAVPAPAPAPVPVPVPMPAPPPKPAAAVATEQPGSAIDPMQWWGALTQQFSEIATQAMKDSPAGMARGLAGGEAASTPRAKAQTKSQTKSQTKPRAKPAAKRSRAAATAAAASKRSRG
jgi:hypothetical protein